MVILSVSDVVLAVCIGTAQAHERTWNEPPAPAIVGTATPISLLFSTSTGAFVVDVCFQGSRSEWPKLNNDARGSVRTTSDFGGVRASRNCDAINKDVGQVGACDRHIVCSKVLAVVDRDNRGCDLRRAGLI